MSILNADLVMSEWTSKRLLERLDFILGMMEKEHHVASTHSERNAYQHVIRIELQAMRSQVMYADTGVERIRPLADQEDSVPF